MFCIQCEQTKRSKDGADGCRSSRGMCGKEASTAGLQDVLVAVLEGMAVYASRAARLGVAVPEAGRFLVHGLFTTLTNVNFDNSRFETLINEALEQRAVARRLYEQACQDQGIEPEASTAAMDWTPAGTLEQRIAGAVDVSLEADRAQVGDDVIGLRLLILYGLKGCAAYTEHARVLGKEDPSIYQDLLAEMAYLAERPAVVDELLAHSLDVGNINFRVMELLDAAGTSRYGHPEPTSVRMTPIKGKCILVSGHDMVDLEAVLQQTEGKGINVYTHGELLPAHAYPGLKKYPHLVGNYGTAWQNQQVEFARFPGAILMTSNCLINPDVGAYRERLFTAGPVGWSGVAHIADGNYGALIAAAEAQPGFEADQLEECVTIGFARNTVLGVADKVIDGVKSGAIRHFFLVGGCDGANIGRNYFTDFAENTPDDTMVLTLGCGKYRFNRHQFGDIGGIPRLLDIGQCNDAYSALKIALALADAFDCGVNDLPLTLVISWFEQKAAAVLLTLLALGIEGIHLGPRLPAFLTPALLNVLVERYKLKPLGDAHEDLAVALAS